MPPAFPATLPQSAARRELALNPTIWRMTGAFMWLIGASIAVFPWLGLGYSAGRMLPLAAALFASGCLFLVRRPPRLGSPVNDLSLVLIWGCVALGTALYAPDGPAAMGAALFVGPIVAMRTLQRLRAVAHLGGASVAFVTAVLLSGQSHATLAVVLCAIAGMWLVGIVATVVLERIDAQADALTHLIRRDPLTGLGNRRLLDEMLGAEVARHRREGSELSIVLLDLDHFKPLNDRAGHAAGDAFLVEVASAIRGAVREQDVAIRPGGDEFCVILPRTDAAGATRLAEVLRQRIAEIGGPNGITASVGTATMPADGSSPRRLLETADAAVRDQKGPRRGASVGLGAGDDVPAGPTAAADFPDVIPFSRAQLATRRVFWRPYGAATLVTAALTGAWGLGVAPEPVTPMFGLAAVLAVFGTIALLIKPPASTSLLGHFAVAATWAGAIGGVLLMQPGGGAGVTIGLAVGPYIALRLPGWRARTAHLLLATLAALAVIASGEIDQASTLLLLLLVSGWWQIATACAVVFASAELQADALGRLLHRDPLTGAGNRLLLDDRLEHELAGHRRSGESLAVFMLDLDGFKAVNDQVGHAAGDALLRAVAAALTTGVRASDVVVRLGGDEFCVVAPQTTPVEAEQLAAALAERVTTAAPDNLPGANSVSTSIGWATFPHDGVTADRLLATADSRLLDAKATRPDLAWR